MARCVVNKRQENQWGGVKKCGKNEMTPGVAPATGGSAGR